MCFTAAARSNYQFLRTIRGTEQDTTGQNVSSDLAKEALCRQWEIAFNFGGGVVKVARNCVEFLL